MANWTSEEHEAWMREYMARRVGKEQITLAHQQARVEYRTVRSRLVTAIDTCRNLAVYDEAAVNLRNALESVLQQMPKL